MNVLAAAATATGNETGDGSGNECEVVEVVLASSNNNGCNKSVSLALDGSQRRRGTGYTRAEDLIVCKAFIAASEDAITGTSQRANCFKNKMHQFYIQYLVEQEKLDKIRYNATFQLSSSDNLNPIYDRRNPSSIHGRFKDVLSGRVSKFIAVENSTVMASGWDTERYYMAVKHNFEQKWPRHGNADDIRHCVDYLRDKPKWQAFNHANQSNESTNHKRPVGQKKEKAMLKDKALVKETMKEMQIPFVVSTLSDDDTNLTRSTAKNDFFVSAGTAMIAYTESLKEQSKTFKEKSDTDFFLTLATPDKKRVMQARTNLMIEEMELKTAEIAAKRRRLQSDYSIGKETDDSDDENN
jgi:hypothetical protein